METSATDNLMIIVLTEHPVLGILLIPYLAEKSPDEDNLRLTEQAFHASPAAMAKMSQAEQKAIEIASRYTEKYLMQVYSHEKTVARFLSKLASGPKKKIEPIRYFIEKKLSEMVQLILEAGLPFYQKQSGSNLLYAHHAYHINRTPVEIVLQAELSGSSFTYQLLCLHENEPLRLTDYKPVVLTTDPPILLLGMELFIFEHIEIARLMPFTKKTSITIENVPLQKYIDNIIIPIGKYHKMYAVGLDIRRENEHCEALLYVEETIYRHTLLKLTFRYGAFTFSPEEDPKCEKVIYRKESSKRRGNKEDDGTAIRFFQRDRSIETKLVQRLIDAGLKRVSDSHFVLSADAPEKTLGNWIINHREMLQLQFHLISTSQKKAYCLDDIHVEHDYKEGLDWFELHITVVIGDLRIPFNRFRRHILEDIREYTLPDGRIILLPEEWFSKYVNLLEIGIEDEKETFRLKRPFVGIAESLLFDNNRPQTPSLQHPPILQAPQGLKATLRPYQLAGFSWLTHLYNNNFGGCLADDMGLGKTLQTLTLLQSIYKSKSAANTEIEATNEKENVESTEERDDAMYNPASVSVDEMGQFSLFNNLDVEEALPPRIAVSKAVTTHKPSTLIVMPTSLLHNWKREARRFTTLSMTEYNTNSHYNKRCPERFFDRYQLIFTSYGMMRNNIDTLRQYRFEYIILDESQNIKNSDSLTFRSAIQLRSQHRLVLTGTPIENSLKDLWAQFYFLQPELLGDETTFHKQFIAPIRQENKHTETRLRQLITPFILRRSKSEVAPELPPLTEETIYCGMSDEQNPLYQEEKNSLRNVLLQLNEHKQKYQPLTILNGITRLRQLACHPSLVHPDFTGSSGKLEQIIDTFETLQSEGHKVLIFSSFVKHLELVADAFSQRKWPYALLTGATATTNRPEEIARFSQSDNIRAFLISLKAGGVGLNLTQADYVFIIDPWWNPAAEAQAIARAHRIGQEKQVIAYRFITQGSIEEKIIQLQEEKRKLAVTFIENSDSLSVLTDNEWANLLDNN